MILHLWQTPRAGGMSDLVRQRPQLLGFKELVQTRPRDSVVPLSGNLAIAINKVKGLKLTVSD